MEKIKDLSNSEVKHITKGNVQYLTFNALEEYKDKITCIVTLRHGGVSSGVYDSLNFRLVGNDKVENVLKNLEIISDVIGIDKNKIYKAKQDHTDNILYITDENKEEYAFNKINNQRIDGYITDTKHVSTLTTSADCNIIVIYDTVNNSVANIHSGWKGTVKKIYIKALEQMRKKFGTNPKDVIVCISPSILKCCFTSKEQNFKNLFTNTWDNEAEYISKDEMEKDMFHIDLSYVIKKDLEQSGVLNYNIHFANICTKCNIDNFYSFRYKTQNNEIDYGTMATIVTLI